MALSITNTIAAGVVKDGNKIGQNFTDISTWANALLPITDANLSSPNNSAYKTLLVVDNGAGFDIAAGTYPLGLPTVLADSSPTTVGSLGLPVIYFDDADYTVGSKTTKLRVRGQVSTNGTVPAITFTFGLYPVTFSGAADVLTATLGTVVAGTTAAIASPSANLTTGAASTDATIPSDGLFCLGVVTSGTLTNNAACLLSAQLSVRNT